MTTSERKESNICSDQLPNLNRQITYTDYKKDYKKITVSISMSGDQSKQLQRNLHHDKKKHPFK